MQGEATTVEGTLVDVVVVMAVVVDMGQRPLKVKAQELVLQ